MRARAYAFGWQRAAGTSAGLALYAIGACVTAMSAYGNAEARAERIQIDDSTCKWGRQAGIAGTVYVCERDRKDVPRRRQIQTNLFFHSTECHNWDFQSGAIVDMFGFDIACKLTAIENGGKAQVG